MGGAKGACRGVKDEVKSQQQFEIRSFCFVLFHGNYFSNERLQKPNLRKSVGREGPKEAIFQSFILGVSMTNKGLGRLGDLGRGFKERKKGEEGK